MAAIVETAERGELVFGVAYRLRTVFNSQQIVTLNVPRGEYVVKSSAEDVAS